MGLTSSKSSSSSSRQQYNSSSSYRAPAATGAAGFARIGDNFNSLNDVQNALRREGLESSQLIVAIDYTKSNEWTGKYSCGGKCLHFLSNTEVNPYQQTIGIIARTLGAFDDDNLIPCYGFGDASTGDRRVFSFKDGDQPCNGLEEVESVYRALTPSVKLSGPTSFAPAIYQAMKIVAESGNQYHILLLVADGQVTRASDMARGQFSPQEQATVDAIVAASAYPLSIVMIGVGDGPWDMMREFDDQLPQRRFDNFQFVNASQIFQRFNPQDWQRMEATFARDALMEIPEQYKAIQKMGLMGRNQPLQFQVLPPCPPPRPRVAPPAQPPAGAYHPVSYEPQQAAAAALAAGAARVSGTGSAVGPSWASANGSFADRNSAGWSGAVTPERTSGHSERVPRPCDGDHTSSEGLFICPITQELMEDPVLAADGYTYERAALERWLTTHNTSPMTNARLPHKNVIPNHALRSSIMEHRQNHSL